MLIYTITNILNGKRYIGQTQLSLDDRITAHKHSAKTKNYPLYYAIRKHGINNFFVEELEHCETASQLNQCEQKWIAHFNTIVPNGYNLMSGGQSNGKHSNETKQRMSQAHKGKKFTEVHKKAMSENHHDVSGSNNPHWGKHLSEETKERIRRPQIGKIVSTSTRQKMSAAWTDERRAACQKPSKMATCHSTLKHYGKGLCEACFYKARHKKRYAPKLTHSLTGVTKTDQHKQHMKDAWAQRRLKLQPKMAMCHPDHRHKAKGLCQKCYDHQKWMSSK